MLEKPDFPDEKLISCLRDDYGLHIVELAFLPLGADVNTAVYRAVADDASPYFLKLRSGAFDETTVAIPRFLSAQGIAQIIAPIETNAGQLSTRVGEFAVILYPFVAGQDGYAAALSDHQWAELGVALKGLHTAAVPPALIRRLPHETYGPYWRDRVRMFQARVEDTAFDDPVAARLAALLRTKRDQVSDLVRRAEQLGGALQTRSLEYVLCHADIHAANVLIGADDALYVVDWDTLIMAPKERDLMFIGGGQYGARHTPHEEETLFYQGYGDTQIDPIALAYYRYERIVEDIAAYCEQLLLTDQGGADREEALMQVVEQFQPGKVIEITYSVDKLTWER